MPTVARFEQDAGADRRPARAGRRDRARTASTCSAPGPTDLGPEIDWHSDFKTGRRWPLRHGSLLPVAYGDGSDIKVPWELSAVPAPAAARGRWRQTGERGYLDELGAQLDVLDRARTRSSSGPTGRPRWTSPSAPRTGSPRCALCAEDSADEPWFEPRAREPAPARPLHPHAPRVDGECSRQPLPRPTSSACSRSPLSSPAAAEGRDWAQLGSRASSSREMEHQVRARRHGARGLDLVPPARDRALRLRDPGGRRARPGPLARLVPRAARARCSPSFATTRGPTGSRRRSATPTTAASCRSATTAPDPRDHRHLFARPDRRTSRRPGERRVPRRRLLRPARRRPLRDRPLRRHGPLRARRPRPQRPALLRARRRRASRWSSTPGRYVYTADPEERNRFRSTAVPRHAGLDGAEQNELRTDDLFAMDDRAQAEALSWDAT